MKPVALLLVMLIIAQTGVQAQVQSGNIQVQSRSGTLQPGVPIERTISSGQTQFFFLKLEQNKCVELVVDQRGIDVSVRVITPQGKLLAEFDTPNGDEGFENVSFVATSAGAYQIGVTPLSEDGETNEGKYEIKLLEVRNATEEELTSSNSSESLKARGIGLLADIEQAISSLHSRDARFRAQLKLGVLLWNSDQKHAEKVFSDLIAAFKDYLENFDDNQRGQIETVRQLRSEILQALMSRVPATALSFLRSTRTVVTPDGSQPLTRDNEEATMEMNIAAAMAKDDPSRAFEIAEQTLKKQLTPDLFSAVNSLRTNSPELAAKLTSDIVEKLLAEKIATSYAAANLAVNLLQQTRHLLIVQTRSGGRPENPAVTPMLSEQDYRALFQKLISEALSYKSPVNSQSEERNAVWNTLNLLKMISADADSITPGSSVAIEKKSAEFSATANPQFAEYQRFQDTLANSSIDASLEAAKQAPAEMKYQVYHQIADRLINNGETTRAKQVINDNFTDPFQRRDLLTNLERQAVYNSVSKGKIEEALRVISTRKSASERAMWISEIAERIGPGHKRATALNLLEQARGMLNPSEQAVDDAQMSALIELSRAFARYDRKRAFAILEPLIDQFNELSAAARTLDGFGIESFQDGELMLQNGNNIGGVAIRLASLLATLATMDYDRAKTATDRFQLPEVRLFVYLEMAQTTIATARPQ